MIVDTLEEQGVMSEITGDPNSIGLLNNQPLMLFDNGNTFSCALGAN